MNNEVNNNTSIGMENNNSNNATKKKSGLAKIIIIIVAVLVVAGGIVFAVKLLSPKKEPETVSKKIDRVAVYNNAISSTFGKINQLSDSLDSFQEKFKIGDKALYFTGDVKIDTNLKELQNTGIDFSKYKLDLAFGLDAKNNQIQLGAGLNDTLKAQLYYKNSRVYLVSNVLEKPVDITNEVKSSIGSSDFGMITSSFAELNKVKQPEISDNIKKITKVFEKIITGAIEKDKIETEESSYEINGKKVEATKLTLTIDEETLKEIIEKAVDELKNDEEFISSLASILDISESDIKEAFKDIDTSDINLNEKMYINVYVQKDSENATGLNIKIGDEELLSFYTYEGSLVLTITNDDEKMTFQTEKKDNGTTFSLKIESEEIMYGTVRQLNKNIVDCDITFNNDDEKTGISIYTTIDEKKSSISGEYKYKLSVNNDYIGISGNYSLESKDKLEDIDVSNAVSLDSVDSDKLITNIQDKVASNADLKTLFELLSS